MTFHRSVRPVRVRGARVLLGCAASVALFFVVVTITNRRGEPDFTYARHAKIHATDLLRMWKQQNLGDCRLPAFQFPDHARDPWGREVRFMCDATDPTRRAVISAGEDRVFGTDDDIASWR